jgi:hypothetical protein
MKKKYDKLGVRLSFLAAHLQVGDLLHQLLVEMWMLSVGGIRTNKVKLKYSQEIMLHYQYIHHRSHIDCFRIESGSL